MRHPVQARESGAWMPRKVMGKTRIDTQIRRRKTNVGPTELTSEWDIQEGVSGTQLKMTPDAMAPKQTRRPDPSKPSSSD
jgi:hypothetical protein